MQVLFGTMALTCAVGSDLVWSGARVVELVWWLPNAPADPHRGDDHRRLFAEHRPEAAEASKCQAFTEATAGGGRQQERVRDGG